MTRGATRGIRRGSRRSFAGLLITLALHGGVVRWRSASAHSKQQAPLVVQRDFVAPRWSSWASRATSSGCRVSRSRRRSTAPPDDDQARRGSQRQAGAARGAQARGPEHLEGSEARARTGAEAGGAGHPEEPDEGSLTGSKLGTSNQAIGDQYDGDRQGTAAAELHAAGRHRRPTQIAKPPTIRFTIGADGGLTGIKLLKSSGNSFVDDACVERRQADRQGAAATRRSTVRAWYERSQCEK